MNRIARGRGIKKNPPGRPPGKDTAASRASSISFPVTDRDEEMVQCSDCGVSLTFYEFRVHNIEAHYNIAKTVDDEFPLDHKYFVRKLQEMAKLTKIANFFCPRKPCESTYKSALGLAYHLETCGKTLEEITANLVECELCHKKYSAPNLKWHKRNAHTQPVVIDPPEESHEEPYDRPRVGPSKRKSAMKAMEFMKELCDVTVKAEVDEDGELVHRSRTDAKDKDFSLTAYHMKKEVDDDEDDQEEKDDNLEVTPSVDFILGCEEVKLEPRSAKRQSQSTTTASQRPDFAIQASKYLEAHPESTTNDPWDTPLRVTEDPLSRVLPKINTLEPIESLEARDYLPLHEKSVLFNTQTKPQGKGKENTEAEFQRLNWFEGKITKSNREEDFVSFTGGPISAMAWHPSGEYLAISTLRDVTETPNILESGSRPSSIQIYCPIGEESDGPAHSLRLVLGLDFGYVNDLRWSTFWPPFDDPESDFAGSDDDRIGYLCAACEDSTCRIFTFRQSDFNLKPTFASQLNCLKNVPVYSKVPEMTLCQDECAKLPTGQCTRFDWDEGNRYVIAGYASGHIGVFDLFSTSKLLREDVIDENENTMVSLNPVWLISSHFSPVTAVTIDPKTPRYFYTGSMDRTLRTWDMQLRQEMECKKIGCVIDMCWIRGWIHLGVSLDSAVSNSGSQYNFLRYYPVGSAQGKPNAIEYFNIVSTSFFEGMTLAGSENGRVTISYYDSFWRECDYDRNKKKKNVINIGKVAIDETSFDPIPFAKEDEDIKQLPDGEEPRLTFIFCRDRCQGSLEVEPSRQEVENVYRFCRFTRVNKVCWSPNGKYITIGYRNGLFAILPADFDKLFT